MESIIDALIPIFILVVLPVMVIWLVTRARTINNEQKMKVLVKAIENGVDIDPALLISETESSRNTKMKLIRRLTVGIIFLIIAVALLICCTLVDSFRDFIIHSVAIFYIVDGVLFAIGIAYTAIFFVGKKYLAPEIEAEGRKLQ